MGDDDQQPLVSTNIQEIEMQERSWAKESTSHALIDVKELERICQSGTELNRRSPSMCIFEVPKCLRDLDKDAYAPQVVGLGPYHHHTATLPRFKELKNEAVLRTLVKIYPDDPLDVALKNLTSEVNQMKEDIQGCYEITFTFDPDMFILDSCFLVEFLLPYNKIFRYPSGYDWNRRSGAFHMQVKRDLLKLENQIPLILIRRLLHLQRYPEDDDIILRLAYRLFGECLIGVSFKHAMRVLTKIEEEPGHLLGYGQQFVSYFVRDADTSPVNLEEEAVPNNYWRWFNNYWCWFVPRDADTLPVKSEGEAVLNKIWSFPRAQELEKAGIKLKRGGTLSFKKKWCGLKGVLTIPALSIDDNTRVGIKNIIALEENLPFKDKLMIGFTAILDNLIDERADVEVLRRAGIIDSFLESDQAVARLINSTGINVSSGPALWGVRDTMKVYYKSSWRVTIKEFMDSHISKPWVLIGTLAAFSLLVLTIVQTVYTVKSYKQGC